MGDRKELVTTGMQKKGHLDRSQVGQMQIPILLPKSGQNAELSKSVEAAVIEETGQPGADFSEISALVDAEFTAEEQSNPFAAELEIPGIETDFAIRSDGPPLPNSDGNFAGVLRKPVAQRSFVQTGYAVDTKPVLELDLPTLPQARQMTETASVVPTKSTTLKGQDFDEKTLTPRPEDQAKTVQQKPDIETTTIARNGSERLSVGLPDTSFPSANPLLNGTNVLIAEGQKSRANHDVQNTGMQPEKAAANLGNVQGETTLNLPTSPVGETAVQSDTKKTLRPNSEVARLARDVSIERPKPIEGMSPAALPEDSVGLVEKPTQQQDRIPEKGVGGRVTPVAAETVANHRNIVPVQSGIQVSSPPKPLAEVANADVTRLREFREILDIADENLRQPAAHPSKGDEVHKANLAAAKSLEKIASPAFEKPTVLTIEEPKLFLTSNLDSPRTAQVSSVSVAALQTSGAPLPFQPVANQIAVAAQSAQLGQTEIRLDPEELGSVRIVMSTKDTGMVVLIAAERPETLDLLRRNAHDLSTSFEDLGFSDTSFTFEQQSQNAEPDQAEKILLADSQETDAPLPKPTIVTLRPDGMDLRL